MVDIFCSENQHVFCVVETAYLLIFKQSLAI
jgi:hypothetical protein